MAIEEKMGKKRKDESMEKQKFSLEGSRLVFCWHKSFALQPVGEL